MSALATSGAGDVARAYLVQASLARDARKRNARKSMTEDALFDGVVDGSLSPAAPDVIDAVEADLDRLLAAAMLAEEDFSENSDCGFSEGAAWQEMIRSLQNLMRSFSMPASASHDSSKAKAKALAGSPFVQFIQALQETKTFPPELRRHHSSTPFALAVGITRAAQSGRPKPGH